jgi:hypothetical protein
MFVSFEFIGSATSARYAHRDCAPAAQCIVQMNRWLASEFYGANPADKLGEDSLTLETRDELSNTAVDASAESDVPAGVATDVESRWICPSAGVAIRGAQKHEHLLAGRNGYAVHDDVFSRSPEKGVNGWIGLQQ